MTGQLEQSHDTDDGKEFQNVVFFLQTCEQEIEVKTQRSDEVYDIDWGAHELQLVVRHYEPNNDFKGEPSVTGALYVEKGLVRFCPNLLQCPGFGAVDIPFRHGNVLYHWYPHVGVRLEAERQDGDDDEKHTGYSNDLQ